MDLNKQLILDQDYILQRNKTLLTKQNINTIYDLLYNFPKKYENFVPSDLTNKVIDETYVIEGTICSKPVVNYLPSKLSTLVFYLETEDEKVRCTVFNRTFLKNKINYGSFIRVKGKFYQNLNNFTVQDIMICDEINRNIIPEYKIKDIALEKYLDVVEKSYRKYRNFLHESLPEELLNQYSLLSIKDTINKIHFADNMNEINKALYRVKFEELLNYQLSMKYLHYKRQINDTAPGIKYNNELIDNFKKSLSYELTVDQEKAVEDILKDLSGTYPMNRLLQGEVGSGKTIVAAIAILASQSDNFQSCLMCPTEILAKQHFETFTELFKDYPNIHIAVLTGSTDAKTRNDILTNIKSGYLNLVIGTHALFQSDVEYHNLGLVVTDEEHRFGVHQRVLIKNKGCDVNYLKMSATPIPRSLAISAYGDTDISIIKTMPKGRKQVITKYIDQEHKKEAMQVVKDELKAHHQIYVVTPLIEESEAIDTANAQEVYQNMQKYFDGIAKVGLIHGRLSAEEKENIMRDFLNNDIQILVATSVIEVGVNVPNATTILILGAERFGVATLHQLRGRVMRSDAVPYCFLIPEVINDNAYERLKMVENNSDGFALAEYDLINRGPGEFFGEKQAGSMNFKYANLQTDKDLLNLCTDIANNLIDSKKLFEDSNYQELLNNAEENYILKTKKLD